MSDRRLPTADETDDQVKRLMESGRTRVTRVPVDRYRFGLLTKLGSSICAYRKLFADEGEITDWDAADRHLDVCDDVCRQLIELGAVPS